MSRWARAARVLEKARAAARALADTKLEAQTLVTAADVARHHGDLGLARRRLRVARGLLRGVRSGWVLANMLSSEANVLLDSGYVREAIARLEQAIRVVPPGDYKAAALLINLGRAYSAARRRVRALGFYRRAVEVLRPHRGLARFRAVALSNLGTLYRRIGLAAEAARYHRQALAVLSRHPGWRRETATARLGLALDLHALGRGRDALSQARRSLALVSGGQAPLAAGAARDVVAYLLSQTGRLAEAATAFERAILRHRRGKLWGLLVRSLLSLAAMRIELRAPLGRVEPLLGESRAIATRLGLPIEWRLPLFEGTVLMRRGRWVAALSKFERAVDQLERERSALRSPLFRTSFLAPVGFAYRQLASAALKLKRPRRAFEALERWRARGLLDRLHDAGVTADSAGAPRSLLRSERSLTRSLGVVQRRIARLGSRPLTTRSRQIIASSLRRRRVLLRRIDGVRAEIESLSPMLPSPRRSRLVSLAQVQGRLLRKGQALLLYSVGEVASLLFVVTSHRVAWYSLPLGRKALAERVNRYRARYLEQPVPRDEVRAIHRGLALYRDLVGIVDRALIDGRDLIVVPDGPLHRLPFEALIVAGDAPQRRKTFLLERHAVTYAPSASVLWRLEERVGWAPPATTGFVGLGDPVYSTGRTRRSASREERRALLGAVARGRPWLVRLPGTGAEVRQLAAMLGGPVRILLGRDARESRVKSGVLRGHRLVHIASHGFADDALQAVVLGVEPDGPDDGFLTAREIHQLKLDAELVVLSACDTGRGKLVPGEGMVGLTYAFHAAGVPRVVASLWKVADRPTVRLMTALYRGVGSTGRPDIAGALRAAKLALLRSRLWRAPFFWASFVAVGLSH